jgi:putative ABC transport system substrate-binding protein
MMITTRLLYAFALAIAIGVRVALTGADDVRLPRVAELYFGDKPSAAYFQNGFRDGLRELGYVDGRNIVLLTAYAEGSNERLQRFVEEFVAQKVDVLFINVKAVPLAKKLTSTIPIVSAGFVDPVAEGHAASLAKPGGNITGVSWQSPDATAKRLELTRELVPRLKRVAILVDPTDPSSMVDGRAFHVAASQAGIMVRDVAVTDRSDFAAVLGALKAAHPSALVTMDIPAVSTKRVELTRFAIDNRLPFISEGKHWAEAGALLAYGPSGAALYKRAAHQIDRILKGAKPGDLPIEQPTTFELIVNLKTAKALGMEVPESILLRADEVIR